MLENGMLAGFAALSLLDDLADFNAVDRHRITRWRVGLELLGPCLRSFFGFKDEHRGAAVIAEPDPVSRDETRGLPQARYGFLP